MLLSFRKRAWDDYIYWFATDRKLCKRIHDLLEHNVTLFKVKVNLKHSKVTFKAFGLDVLTREEILRYSPELAGLRVRGRVGRIRFLPPNLSARTKEALLEKWSDFYAND